MNAKATLPPDWKPAAFNPNFNADDELDEQSYRLHKLGCVLNVISDLSLGSGTVELQREELAGLFRLLHDVVKDTTEHSCTIHKHISNKWGTERIQAERELRGEE